MTEKLYTKPKQKKVIFHIDYDSFFASVEQQANPLLRGKPIGVTGSSLTKGIICAASIEAKKYGVKTAMPIFKAKELCPHIITVKGDFTKYQHIQKKSLEIFNKYTNLIEPFSIDEAFLDVTGTVKFFATPEDIAFKIKQAVYAAFGPYITCSIGIGPNKLLAKLVSDFNKPNGLFRVTENNLKTVLKSAKLTDFCGIGHRIEKRLNNLGIFTVAQLQKVDMEILYKNFGNVSSNFLKQTSFGFNDVPVQNSEFETQPKSIGHQHTLSKNTKSLAVIKNNLMRLSEMVGRRLRKQKMMGKTIITYLRKADFTGTYERTTLKDYTDNSQRIYKTVEVLLRKIIQKHRQTMEVRLVGVSISNLIPKKQTTIPLFPSDQKAEKITKASDLVNDKFGEFTVITANTLRADKTKGKISSFLRY